MEVLEGLLLLSFLFSFIFMFFEIFDSISQSKPETGAGKIVEILWQPLLSSLEV